MTTVMIHYRVADYDTDLLPELVTAGVEMSSVRIDYVDELESGSH